MKVIFWKSDNKSCFVKKNKIIIMPVVMPIDSYNENGRGKYVKAKLAAINKVN